MMHHIVYQTTNLINGKIYVGVHSTDDLNDGYLGSGFILKKAINKYGKKNFERKILFNNCENSDIAYWLESIIVNRWFIEQNQNYNSAVGGGGVLCVSISKNCEKCNRNFITTSGVQKYCPECKEKAYDEQQKNWRIEKGMKIFDIPRICQWCGNEFIASHSKQKYCNNDTCSNLAYVEYSKKYSKSEKAIKYAKNYRKKRGVRPIGVSKTCEWCNTKFITKTGNQKYCIKCKDEKYKEIYRNSKREQRKKDGIKTLDIPRICKGCNKNYTPTNGKQKYCPECKKEYDKKYRERNKEKSVKASRNWYANNKNYHVKYRKENKEKINANNRKRRKKNGIRTMDIPRICKFCDEIYMPTSAPQKYCKECKEKAYKIRKNYYKNKKESD